MPKTTVTCTACEKSVGKMGIGKHWGMHRREFREAMGRPPEDKDEVRAWVQGNLVDSGDQASIEEFA